MCIRRYSGESVSNHKCIKNDEQTPALEYQILLHRGCFSAISDLKIERKERKKTATQHVRLQVCMYIRASTYAPARMHIAFLFAVGVFYTYPIRSKSNQVIVTNSEQARMRVSQGRYTSKEKKRKMFIFTGD